MKFRTLAASLAVASAATYSCTASADTLAAIAKIQPKSINESSGIIKSRQFENTYWTHNDSGDTARIFAITPDGQAIQTQYATENKLPYEGIPIGDAVNIDWEDIATDDQGNLLIGAFGNNANTRRDLAIYIVPEPNPTEQWSARARRRIDFHFPEQTKFPDTTHLNFDCESLFYAHGKIYVITKNRSDTLAQLYRLDATEPFVNNPATLISSYPVGGNTTAADISPDGRKLALLTYTGCWIFIAPEGSDDYFAGQAFHKPFIAKQCEAICWENETTLLITNEQRDIYRLPLADIPPVN